MMSTEAPRKTREMKRVVVFGNGVFAEHMAFLLTHDSPYEVSAFTVDRKYIKHEQWHGVSVVPFETVEERFPPSAYGMLVAVSFQRMNRLREAKYREAKGKGYTMVNYVSSRAITYPGLATGDNCIILEAAVIAPYVTIGNDVTIATSVIVGHHTAIHDHAFVAPGAVLLGGVTVGEYSLIGANATVKEEVRIGRDSLIGSGVAISRDTVERGVYLSPPAQLHPRRSDELRTWLMWPVRGAEAADRS